LFRSSPLGLMHSRFFLQSAGSQPRPPVCAWRARASATYRQLSAVVVRFAAWVNPAAELPD
jgi:hypothetical protein